MREVFHAGERELQARAGSREQLAAAGEHIVRDHLQSGYRSFLAGLPYLVLGTVDDAGRPWASMRTGQPGFVSSPDERTVTIDLGPTAGDPVVERLVPGAWVGTVAIELHTRRRIRANGRVRVRDGQRVEIEVLQAFGNCPKYIVPREALSLAPSAVEVSPLGPDATAAIRRADTLFLASWSGDGAEVGRGVDVSHRGGPAGFVQIGDDGVLSIPDYPGNRFFDTLGNVVLHPRLGLLVVDFASGDAVQLTGAAWVEEAGGERRVRIRIEDGVHRRGAVPICWSDPLR